jgi:hypothetical protein
MARTTPDWSPESEEDYEAASSELKKRFAQWLGVVGLESHGDDGEAPIHYKWAYVDGHLTRWTRRDLDEVYLELHPAKVMVEDDDLDEVLEEAKNFIGFLDETGLLDPDSESADVLVDHLETIEEQFRHNMADACAIASASGCGPRLWPRASASTTGRRSRPSWPTSTPGRSPNATPSWARVSPRDRRPPAGSPRRGRGPRLPQPSAASVDDDD